MKKLFFLISFFMLYLPSSLIISNAETLNEEKIIIPNEYSKIVITKDNFLEYFTLNGSARYNQTTGILTVTPDEKYQVGSATFNKKILFSQDIDIDVDANIGDKNKSRGGADGIGIGFHDADINVIGGAGNGFGLGQLPGSIGFKLDTYYNDRYGVVGKAESDPSRFKDRSFGGFISGKNDEDNSVYTIDDAATYGVGSLPKIISDPSNNDFNNLKINFKAGTNLFYANYSAYGNSLNWMLDMNKLPNYIFNSTSPKAKSLIFAGSTGGQTNLQQYKINKITITVPIGVVKKIDKRTNKGIQGAVFDLYDLNNIIIASDLTSDELGYIYLSPSIESGEYYLIEKKAPEGYVLDSEKKHSVIVDNNKTTNYIAAQIDNIPINNYLHVKQEVINTNEDVVVPTIGNLFLDNINKSGSVADGGRYSMTIPSYKADSKQPYKGVKLGIFEGYEKYQLKNILPEFHDYVGYQLTTKEEDHSSNSLINKKIPTLDFLEHSEYWLTIYIEPKVDINGPPFYSWDYKTNNFGNFLNPKSP